MKKGALLLALLLAMQIAPAMAETVSVSLPGLTLSVPGDMLVYTRETYNAASSNRGDISGMFDDDKDLYLAGESYTHEYYLLINITEEKQIADFSKADSSLNAYAESTKTVLQQLAPLVTVDTWPEIQTIGQTRFIYVAYHKGMVEDPYGTLQYETVENGMQYRFAAYIPSLPLSDAATAEFQQIIKSIAFHNEKMPEVGSFEGGVKAPVATVPFQYAENGYGITLLIPESMKEIMPPTSNNIIDRMFVSNELVLNVGMDEYWTAFSTFEPLLQGLTREDCDFGGLELLKLGFDTETLSGGKSVTQIREEGLDINGRPYLVLEYSVPINRAKPEGSIDSATGTPMYVMAILRIEDGIWYNYQFYSVDEPELWRDTALQIVASAEYTKE